MPVFGMSRLRPETAVTLFEPNRGAEYVFEASRTEIAMESFVISTAG